LENLHYDVDMNRAWEYVIENTKTSATGNISYKLKQHKQCFDEE